MTHFVDNGLLKILFVKMAENVSNMFTKNVSSDIHEKHKGEYIWTKEDLD